MAVVVLGALDRALEVEAEAVALEAAEKVVAEERVEDKPFLIITRFSLERLFSQQGLKWNRSSTHFFQVS